MSEWFKELVLKTSDPARGRGFESHSLRHFLNCCEFDLEKYPRGRRGSPAKGVGGESRARVQIPPSAPARRKRLIAYDEFFNFTAKLIVRSFCCSSLPNRTHSVGALSAPVSPQRQNFPVFWREFPHIQACSDTMFLSNCAPCTNCFLEICTKMTMASSPLICYN